MLAHLEQNDFSDNDTLIVFLFEKVIFIHKHLLEMKEVVVKSLRTIKAMIRVHGKNIIKILSLTQSEYMWHYFHLI
jgi:hypothetical protein